MTALSMKNKIVDNLKYVVMLLKTYAAQLEVVQAILYGNNITIIAIYIERRLFFSFRIQD